MKARVDRQRWLRWGLLTATLVGIAFLPSLLGAYWRFFLAEIVILALLAMSFSLVYGYGGMLSFCQGTFYGIGAYVVAWLALRGDMHPLVILLAAIGVAAVMAGLVGLIFVRMGGHNFTIATVIFAVIAFLGGNTLRSITGGEDGISFSVPSARLVGISFPPSEMLGKLYLAVGVLIVLLVLIAGMARSVPGKIVVAIRENEVRARFLGYNVRAWRLAVFTAGGGIAGLAGGLYSLTVGHVSTEALEIGLSVYAILWSVIGGVGTVAGPLIGVLLLLPLTDYLSSLIVYAQIPVGVLLIVVIALAPDGIVGWLGKVWSERLGRAEALGVKEANKAAV